MILIAIGYRLATTIFVRDQMIISIFPLAHVDAFTIVLLMALNLSGEKKGNINKCLLLSAIGSILIINSTQITGNIIEASNIKKVNFGAFCGDYSYGVNLL